MSISSNSSFEYITDDDDVGNWETKLRDEDSGDSDIEGLEVIGSDDSDFSESEDTKDAVVPKSISKPTGQVKKRDVYIEFFIFFFSALFLWALLVITKPLKQGNIYEALKYVDSEKSSFDVETWTLKMDHENARVSHALKLHEAIEKFDGMTFDEKQRMNKWTPLPAKFIGVKAFLESIGQSGTATEEFLYRSTPRFFNRPKNPRFEDIEFVLDNFKISTYTESVNILSLEFFKGAQLEICEKYRDKIIKRVYYVKSEDLLSLLD
ncbi:hypothetical protein GCK72_021958 [Caenorhabditis remanei]|uniref:Uncharacterized protein n=1 Tax=Caenorhabditis remanei TaxID=31234 RepID=A0A6A5GM49_CAERE|nr:hypothetical protein GCK72_021958 [Caenorhabditis remanei]KAF1755389.1 hypothetical protein GCK72_021958 [Caenorhabditis remanei]